jgi:hypothetical protein
MPAEKERAIHEFRGAINEFKKKCLEGADKEGHQDVADLTGILQKLDMVHDRIRGTIMTIGAKPVPTESEPFENALYTKGGLAYLRSHPDAANDFTYHLQLDLKQYPFTINPHHIDEYKPADVPAAPTLISNGE